MVSHELLLQGVVSNLPITTFLLYCWYIEWWTFCLFLSTNKFHASFFSLSFLVCDSYKVIPGLSLSILFSLSISLIFSSHTIARRFCFDHLCLGLKAVSEYSLRIGSEILKAGMNSSPFLFTWKTSLEEWSENIDICVNMKVGKDVFLTCNHFSWSRPSVQTRRLSSPSFFPLFPSFVRRTFTFEPEKESTSGRKK